MRMPLKAVMWALVAAVSLVARSLPAQQETQRRILPELRADV